MLEKPKSKQLELDDLQRLKEALAVVKAYTEVGLPVPQPVLAIVFCISPQTLSQYTSEGKILVTRSKAGGAYYDIKDAEQFLRGINAFSNTPLIPPTVSTKPVTPSASKLSSKKATSDDDYET